MTHRTRLPDADELFRSTEAKDAGTPPGSRVAADRSDGDEGRIVRAALDDLDARGDESALVRRLKAPD